MLQGESVIEQKMRFIPHIYLKQEHWSPYASESRRSLPCVDREKIAKIYFRAVSLFLR